MSSHLMEPSLFAISSDPEWQFETCPTKQLHWCDIYEHARDNKRVVEMVARYRSKNEWAVSGLFLDQSSSVLGKALIDAFPEFPAGPFLSLKATVRADRCRLLDCLRSKLQVDLIDDCGSHGKSEETILLRIHRRAPRAALMRAVCELAQEGLGPQRPDKNLQYLAVARLYVKLGGWPAVLRHLEKVGHDLSMKNESQCSKYKKKAASNIESALRRVL
jgi:hypothetical protein